MLKHFNDGLQYKPKLVMCSRNISNTSGKALIPIGECFILLQIGRRIFRDGIIVIQNLKHNYILDQVLHGTYRFGMGYTMQGNTT